MAEYPDRAQLQQIIAGVTEGIILIEPDQAITYANEAALAAHGVGDLEELGRSIAAYLSAFEVRTVTKQAIEPGQTPIERLAAGETFDGVLVEVRPRTGDKAERTHRLRGLVVTTPKGLPDCHVLVVTDVTDHVEAEQRFESMFAANPAPAAICRLADLRFIKVNEGFLQLTGYGREDVLGRSVYEIDVLQRAENRTLAIERLKAGETIPQMEACLGFPKDPEHFVIVAGQPIEVGTEPCMLFTFADLEDRRKAEMALVRSEERFAKAFLLSPVPTMVGTVDEHRFVEVNEAFGKVMGYGPAEVVGRTADDLKLWADAGLRRAFESDFAAAGSVRAFEAKYHAKDGTEIDCLVSAELVTINEQPCVLCAFQDITERKRSEGELVAAIEAAMADTSWFSRGVMEKLAALRQRSGPAAAGARVQDLTPRERQIIDLICRGARDKEIGAELRLSPHTVRNHVATLFRKLGVNRRSALVIWARERGLDGAVRIAESQTAESTNLLA